jgi:REP element-mobilizing transposase RayT
VPHRKPIRLPSEVYTQPGVVVLATACTEGKREALENPSCAQTVVDELTRLHGPQWRVFGYCVMPNHVHLLLANVDGSVIDFMRLFKGRTAASLRGQVDGRLWQRSFHDHVLRRNENIVSALRYLFNNPVRAGLVGDWTEHPWTGSLVWPDIGPEFFMVDPSDIVWAEMFRSDQGRG